LFGADNADAMRGLGFSGVYMDEYGDFRPSVWGNVAEERVLFLARHRSPDRVVDRAHGLAGATVRDQARPTLRAVVERQERRPWLVV